MKKTGLILAGVFGIYFILMIICTCFTAPPIMYSILSGMCLLASSCYGFYISQKKPINKTGKIAFLMFGVICTIILSIVVYYLRQLDSGAAPNLIMIGVLCLVIFLIGVFALVKIMYKKDV